MGASSTPVLSSDAASTGSAVRCRGLVKRYKDTTAVDGLDLDIELGECFGLLGPNGAGKTTTVEILEGLIPPTAGSATVLGRRWGRGHDRWIRQRLGIQLQESQLPDKLKVEEAVELFGSFFAGGRTAEEAIRTVELGEKRHARIEKLSGGQRQRLSLACALVGDPQLLFLDEPSTGLDPQARLKIWEVVEGFRQGGGTVVLTTHYMEEATRLCDRVAILDQGRVIAQGSPAELIASLGTDQILRFEVEGELSQASLASLPGVDHLDHRDGAWVLNLSGTVAALPQLLAEVERQEARLVTLTTHQATLEDVFVHLTGRALRDD